MAGIYMQQIDIVYMQMWFTVGMDESKAFISSSPAFIVISFEDTNKNGKDQVSYNWKIF